MKHIFLIVAFAALMFGCGGDRAVTPDITDNCNFTDYMPSHAGDYWIYERVPLDSNGMPQVQSNPTLDSMVVSNVETIRNDSSIILSVYSSKDGGITKDFDGYIICYLQNGVLSFSRVRVGKDEFPCGSTLTTRLDTTYKVKYLTQNSVADTMLYKQSMILTKKELLPDTLRKSIFTLPTRSFYFGFMSNDSIVYPNDVTFSKGTRTTNEIDDETFWLSKNVGIVQYKRFLKTDSVLVDLNPDFPYGYQRTLIRYSVKK